jgi:hypothetical protein
MGGSNIEGGPTYDYDDGGKRSSHAVAALARQVAWKRQARAYSRLRDVIDTHYLRTPYDAQGVEVRLELPHRLSGWRTVISTSIRQAYPSLSNPVKQIERLVAERTVMRADPTSIPASTYKRVPLPTDPAARETERNRRAVVSMRALRQRRREAANLDLIGL